MKYSTSEIAKILSSQVVGSNHLSVHHICIDSRNISTNPKYTLFVALIGNIVDGHNYVTRAYDQGVRSFLVSKKVALPDDATMIIVPDTLSALQLFAAHHRNKYDIPVIAITGSNGKTIIKEWLSQLLSKYKCVVKSPKSYNSQIGVALSVLMIEEHHEIGVFEAGISQPNEMVNLEQMTLPSIGIFTNIGDAHSSGFTDKRQKFEEKAKLFDRTATIVYNANDELLSEWMKSRFRTDQLHPYTYRPLIEGKIKFNFGRVEKEIKLPYFDEASIQNVLAAISVLSVLNIDIGHIDKDLQLLDRVQMRMETKMGKWNSTLINDAYSSDLQSLSNAIQHLKNIPVEEPIIILSNLLDNIAPDKLYPDVADLLRQIPRHQLITVGNESKQLATLLNKNHVAHYDQVSDIEFDKSFIQNKTILLKGARQYKFELLYEKLSAQSHSAYLEIDLTAMEHNLSVYASLIPAKTKIMTVLKASAYGSGASKLAKHLQHRQVGYVAVAYVDEGIELRESGIVIPIIIFNPDLDQLSDMMAYGLEPEVYSMAQLKHIVKYSNQKINIHIKLDTGMHRLGFGSNELDLVCDLILSNSHINIASIFSHLAASDNDKFESFTRQQIQLYEELYALIVKKIGYKPLRHIANTSAITRYPDAHYDIVRLGLGLYGIESNNNIADRLERVHTLKAKIIQVKYLAAGESVGYNRSHILTRESKVGIVNIGYADGLMRSSGNSKHLVSINGQLVPILGSVCMDLIMIDLTDINALEGDEVELFGKMVDIVTLANINQTIPYEILTGISPRVKKIYVSN